MCGRLRKRPLPGQIGYINDNSVLLGSSEDTYDRLITLALADDIDGMNQLILSGLVYSVSKGTQCRVIDTHGWLDPTFEVRILNGPKQSSLGFTGGKFLSLKK